MGHSIVKQHQAIQQTVYKVALKNEANGQTSIVFKWPAGGSFSGWPKAPSSAISINMFQQRFCSRLCYQVSFSTAWSSFSQFDTVVRHPLASSLKRLPSALHCCHPCTQKRSKVSFILQTITFLNMSNTITIQLIFYQRYYARRVKVCILRANVLSPTDCFTACGVYSRHGT